MIFVTISHMLDYMCVHISAARRSLASGTAASSRSRPVYLAVVDAEALIMMIACLRLVTFFRALFCKYTCSVRASLRDVYMDAHLASNSSYALQWAQSSCLPLILAPATRVKLHVLSWMR